MCIYIHAHTYIYSMVHYNTTHHNVCMRACLYVHPGIPGCMCYRACVHLHADRGSTEAERQAGKRQKGRQAIGGER